MRNAATTGRKIGYGWLYNWYAVGNAHGLAPDGWIIPGFEQWEYLSNYLISEYPEVTEYNIGATLKSQEHWAQNPGTDIFLFNGIPSGRRMLDGEFINRAGDFYMYSSTDLYSENYVWATNLSQHNQEFLYLLFFEKANGTSIRCIQEKSIGESDKDTGTLTDVDGNIYKWVVIGDYRWMAENLRTTKYKNGNTIPEITDDNDWENDTTGARCAYNNDHYHVYPPLK